MELLEILKECVTEGNVVKLPQVDLDRNQYLKVKKSLEGIGGKWKGGKVSGFVFSTDPTDLLGEISGGVKINLKKDFQFFATPSDLAKRLVELAELDSSDDVLEPSAGQGAIIEHINSFGLTPDCYELMEQNRIVLDSSDLNFELKGDDFLKSKSDKKYSKIIANPPFSKNQDIDHVYKMYDVLEPGGELVTIMSTHWQSSSNKKETSFRSWLMEMNHEVIELNKGEFKTSGTSVATDIVMISKTK